MVHCPRCQSPNLVSGKLDQKYAARALQFAKASQHFENRRLTAVGGIVALAIKAVDVFFKDLDCGHQFDV
jgi:hypothetical protein